MPGGAVARGVELTAPAAKTRSVEAPAKVNLFLRVLGRRPDGYHELETLIVPISLCDRLEVHADADPSFRTLSLSLEVTGAPDTIRGVPKDESNLVLRAAQALAERTGVRGFAEIGLEKRIPSEAGLGGGSSDAAATLLTLNDLWGCGLDAEALGEVGASVGSDVPVLLAGGPALVRGRGEIVESMKLGSLDLALVTFDFGISTPDAFRWWDEAGGPTCRDARPLFAPAGEPDPRSFFNDLEGPVIQRRPRIEEVKRALLEGGAVAAVMTGSGPTVFGALGRGAGYLDPGTEERIQAAGGALTYVRAGPREE